MRINHEVMSRNTHRQLENTQKSREKTIKALASAMRINSASDDVAGLSISENMRSQFRGLHQASRNAQDGVSMLQTAEGALNEVNEMLVRAKELYIQKGNTALYSDEDMAQIDKEITSLTDEMTNIAKTTNFNGKNLLEGITATEGKIQIGEGAGEVMELELGTLANAVIEGAVAGTANGIEFSKDQATGLEQIENAIKGVSDLRSSIGSLQNRLEHTVDNINTTAQNLQASESQIRDADMALQMMALTRQNLLSNSSQAMMAQSNHNASNVLSLLG